MVSDSFNLNLFCALIVCSMKNYFLVKKFEKNKNSYAENFSDCVLLLIFCVILFSGLFWTIHSNKHSP